MHGGSPSESRHSSQRSSPDLTTAQHPKALVRAAVAADVKRCRLSFTLCYPMKLIKAVLGAITGAALATIVCLGLLYDLDVHLRMEEVAGDLGPLGRAGIACGPCRRRELFLQRGFRSRADRAAPAGIGLRLHGAAVTRCCPKRRPSLTPR